MFLQNVPFLTALLVDMSEKAGSNVNNVSVQVTTQLTEPTDSPIEDSDSESESGLLNINVANELFQKCFTYIHFSILISF